MRTHLLIISLSIYLISNAQTNEFPPSGPVGIGISNPTDILHINGSGSLYSRMQSSTDNQLGHRYMTASHSWISGLHGGESGKYKISYASSFGTNDFFTIRNNGNVGIGTVDPSNKLQVEGQVRFNPGLGNNNYVQFQSNNSSQLNMLFFVNNSAQWNLYTQLDGRLNFRRTDNNSDGGIKMVIRGDNVGIGTTTPSDNLEVYKNIRIGTVNGSAGITDNNMFGNASGLILGNAGFLLDNDNSATNLVSRLDLKFYVNEKDGSSLNAMQINRDGKVGIGTSNPDDKLTVKGKIHSEEVRVDLQVPGPDYVFKDDYNLISLEEVQNYINEHGHLPNIPSAKEMEENGIELGLLNMKLLEKIEELTLYTIDQEEAILKIKELETQNERLNAKLSELEEKINLLINTKN